MKTAALLLSFLLIPLTTGAQLLPSAPQLFIESSSLAPSPEETVTLSLRASGLTLTGAPITWSVNGAELTEFQNRQTMNYSFAGEDQITVRATATVASTTYEATRVFTPRSVDIVIEADTYAPAFYEGRREPSPGSLVRAIAIMSGTDPETLSYRFEVDGAVLGGGAARGRQSVQFQVPQFSDGFTIRVDVYDDAGVLVATSQRIVSMSTPRTVFYEDSLLRGTSHNAIRGSHTLVGEEISVRAVPFFMDRNIFSGTYNLAWRANGEDVTGFADAVDVITLRKNGGEGAFPVEFTLLNGRSPLQQASGGFSIIF